ncbi:MAG: hypothetical protein NVS4B11_01350 [Ktedonobacteraceae bacterium]
MERKRVKQEDMLLTSMNQHMMNLLSRQSPDYRGQQQKVARTLLLEMPMLLCKLVRVQEFALHT